ncbi:MAG TPA: response regulator transcription factor [Methylomirabilota bacterium]|nr:response regulator transcription factor [Methylomirabilota bacterium]
MRILLVDDDDGFRAAVLGLLMQGTRAVEVEEAADGETAVRMASRRPPDVVLMDLTMPRVNGLEATRRLKARWPDLPVIILTVHDDPTYERTARAAGANDFLVKKTAGTALWPAIGRLVPAGSGRGEAGVPASGDQARAALARARSRGDSPPAFGNLPDWRPVAGAL